MIPSAPLPSSDIEALDLLPITFTMNIGLYISSENRRKIISEDLESLIGTNEIFSAHVTGINVDLAQVANVKTPARLEQLIVKQFTVKPGNLLIIEWKNLEDDILVSSDRTIFISDRVCEFFMFDFSFLFLTILFSQNQLRKNFTKSSEPG